VLLLNKIRKYYALEIKFILYERKLEKFKTTLTTINHFGHPINKEKVLII